MSRRPIANELDLAIASRAKELRDERGWSQSELAERMRVWGFPWDRGVVAGIETGRRHIEVLSELIGLASVFGVRLRDLIPESEGGLSLNPRLQISGRGMRAALEGKAGGSWDWVLLEPPQGGKEAGAWRKFTAEIDAFGELERAMAQRFNLEPVALVREAYALWSGLNPTAERDQRHAKTGRSKRHISRDLFKEMERHLARRKKR